MTDIVDIHHSLAHLERSLDRATQHHPPRVRMGNLAIDPLTFEATIDRIDELVAARRGGAVFTPNADHVVMAEENEEFVAAYGRADLCLADGQIVVWASRAISAPVPQRVSGSDLLMPLMERAALRGWRVYLMGGGPGVAAEAAERITAACPVDIVGHDAPEVTVAGDPEAERSVIERVRFARPDLLLVAFGAPKQEMFIDRVRHEIRPAVAIGVGAALDFAAGRVTRAPVWMSDAGLEWLYRLSREPRRLWRRYLIEDPRFLMIALRSRQANRPDEASPRPATSEEAA